MKFISAKTSHKKITYTAFIFFAACFFYTNIASAEYSISAPTGSTLKFQIKAGQQESAKVSITNNSTKEVLLGISAADATKTKTGGFAVNAKEQKSKELGTWITPEKTEIKLAANQKTDLIFTINIPANTPAGDYAAGIIAQEINETDKSILKNSIRTVAPIFVTVPGEIKYNLYVKKFSYEQTHNQILFTEEIENNSNGNVKVKTSITVEELWGLIKYRIDPKEITLLKNSGSTIKFQWNKNPIIGLFKATAKITTEPNLNIPDQHLKIAIIKWDKLLIGFGIIIAMATLIHFRRNDPSKNKKN